MLYIYCIYERLASAGKVQSHTTFSSVARKAIKIHTRECAKNNSNNTTVEIWHLIRLLKLGLWP